jgi:hypothetical protein
MHCSRLSIFTWLVVATAPGCMSGFPEEAEPVMFDRLPEISALRSYGGITTRERLVIRDQKTWASTWVDIVGSLRPVPPTPSVDFADQVLIVTAMGTRSSGGYAIEIEEVHTWKGDAWISVREQSPGPSCLTTDAFSDPVDVAVVPRFDGEASFLEHSSEHDCR